MTFRITSLSAWTQIDSDDEEGILAFFDRQRETWVPMIAADHQRIVSLRPYVESIVRATGRPVMLRRWSVEGVGIEIERIEP